MESIVDDSKLCQQWLTQSSINSVGDVDVFWGAEGITGGHGEMLHVTEQTDYSWDLLQEPSYNSELENVCFDRAGEQLHEMALDDPCLAQVFNVPQSPNMLPEHRNFRSVPESASTMRQCLEAAMCGGNGGKRFMPEDSLQNIISEEAVILELQQVFPYIALDHSQSLAGDIVPSKRKIFATLVMLNQTQHIYTFLDVHIDDTQLPLRQGSIPSSLAQVVDATLLQDFTHIQWLFMSPVFQHVDLASRSSPVLSTGLLDLADDTVLPFIESTEKEEIDHYRGGNSEVFRVKIHPAHWNYTPRNNGRPTSTSFAVKKLHSHDEQTYRREVEVLRRLQTSDHPNVVSLLGSYRYKGHYHLVFEWAEGDLRRLWQSHPSPPSTGVLETRWLADQCSGIASALYHVHTGADGTSAGLSGTPHYGLHGDIKPENILVFSHAKSAQALADFDVKSLPSSSSSSSDLSLNLKPTLSTSPSPLATIHDILSTNQTSELVLGDFGGFNFYDPTDGPDPLRQITTTYRPPEYDTKHKPISQFWDVWGLGCTFVEFLTWFLKGSAGVDEFACRRATINSTGRLSDEYFDVIPINDGASIALLKVSVSDWINELYCHERSSQFVRDFLELILNRMLAIDTQAASRINSTEINTVLGTLAKRCHEDQSYCLPSRATQLPQSFATSDSSSPRASPASLDIDAVATSPSIQSGSMATDFRPFKTWDTAPTLLDDNLSDLYNLPALPLASHTVPVPQVTQSIEGITVKKRKRSPVRESSSIKKPCNSLPHRSADGSASRGNQKLACPFFKNDPAEFKHKRTCCGPGWPTVHRVKEHLYRCHTAGKHSCPQCLLKCRDASDLLDHQKASKSCITNEHAVSQGTMTPCQEAAMRIKRRADPDTTEEQRWHDVFQILFPGRDPGSLPSAFYDDDDPHETTSINSTTTTTDDLSAFRYFLASSTALPRAMHAKLERQIQDEFGFVGTEIQAAKVVDMVRGLQLSMIDEYRALAEADL